MSVSNIIYIAINEMNQKINTHKAGKKKKKNETKCKMMSNAKNIIK